MNLGVNRQGSARLGWASRSNSRETDIGLGRIRFANSRWTESIERRGAEVVTLRPKKSFEVLAYRVAHHGELVSKAALMQAVWPDTAVTDNSLAQCM